MKEIETLDHEEFDEEVLAAEDHAEGHCVGCCDTAFHIVNSEEEFQALLRGLNSDEAW